MKPKPRSSGVKVLDKTLDLLEAVGKNEKGSSLTELASLLDLPVGTVHRLLQHLLQRGYVEHDSTSKLYFLGLRVLVLRGQAIQSIQLAARVRPFLLELTSAANCLSHLAVYRDGQVVYVDRVDTRNTAATFVPAGKHVPAHTVALGKVFLAALSPQELEAYLTGSRLAKCTPFTMTEPNQLRGHLRRVGEQGYALDMQEAELGGWCIAAPVRDYTGCVIAAISVSMREEPDHKRLDELVPLVTDTALAISKDVGFQPSSNQAVLDLQIH